MDVYLDKLLLKNKKLYLGSGEYVSSVQVNTKQYLKIEEPALGAFSAQKK
jgi:hypothetical protein